MKLNTRRTVLVGLAFLSICAFWQMYDSVVPLILTKTFHLDETWSGTIMAADNILALFLLPFFGALSDRTSTRIGRRMPFIVGGTLGAVLLMNLLPLLDNRYYALTQAGAGGGALAAVRIGFIVVLGLLLVCMGTYRSPAVALMPDVTPKPLRSRGNAIINLMGALGGLLYLGVAAVLYSQKRIGGLAHVNYTALFAVVTGIMAVSVLVLYFTVNEPKLAAENRRYEEAHPEQNLAQTTQDGEEVLPAPVKRSLAFLLVSIALWFIGYNGVTTWFTTYIDCVMGEGLGGASTCLMVATGGAVVSYIPIGALAARIGRKKTILCGAAVGVLLCRVSGHGQRSHHHPGHVCAVCAGRAGMGGHQRQQPAHGGGNVPRQRRGQIHRLLLHLLHGGAGCHPHSGGLAAGPCGLYGAVPLCGVLCGVQLCHHAVCAPRRQ